MGCNQRRKFRSGVVQRHGQAAEKKLQLPLDLHEGGSLDQRCQRLPGGLSRVKPGLGIIPESRDKGRPAPPLCRFVQAVAQLCAELLSDHRGGLGGKFFQLRDAVHEHCRGSLLSKTSRGASRPTHCRHTSTTRQ